MEEIRVSVKDKAGKHVGGLVVNLEHTGGPEGSYMPFDALTGVSTGSVLRGAHPGKYNVILMDRKQQDYEGKTQRNKMTFPIEVVFDGKNEFNLIWTYPTPEELDSAVKDKVTLTFLDKSGKPVPELWVSLSPGADKSPEPRQIVLGITNSRGQVYWPQYEFGEFVGGALRSETEGDGPYTGGPPLRFTVKGASSFTFTWEPME